MNWSLSKLREIVEDREAWYAAVTGSQRVGHDQVTEQRQPEHRASAWQGREHPPAPSRPQQGFLGVAHLGSPG